MATCHDHIVIAAIDFGTTYSGYAFSDLDALNKDPTAISMANWIGKYVSKKIPTCVLFKPDKTFDSCGFTAEENTATWRWTRRIGSMKNGTSSDDSR